jgi:hypothetical protein
MFYMHLLFLEHILVNSSSKNIIIVHIIEIRNRKLYLHYIIPLLMIGFNCIIFNRNPILNNIIRCILYV